MNQLARNFMVAPASLGAESVTLIWDKPETYHEVVEYRIIMNEEHIGTSIPKKLIIQLKT